MIKTDNFSDKMHHPTYPNLIPNLILTNYFSENPEAVMPRDSLMNIADMIISRC
jgi:hypothetical protein